MEKKKRSVLLILIFVCFASLASTTLGFGQDSTGNMAAYQKAVQIASRLSPEEKIGQLFLITFDGTEVDEDSEIYELITDYYIGGVVLKGANGNFLVEESISETYDLITNLQTIEWETRNKRKELPSGFMLNDYIPLFIGISQSGGSYPYDQIIEGITYAPSQMAIGATWDTTFSENIGALIGRELESLGINLLLGPSLDVLDITYNEKKINLGVQTFGGDPFWVGEMGAAYINGVHNGSENRIAVIASNFPGRGSTDRFPEEEVATVRKSLDQLQLIDLAPFFRVSDNSFDQMTEGLLNSHIRYQGFQGNIRATTKPISFDQNALELLMGLSPLNEWYEGGGLLVTDDLGSLAVYKFFDPNGQFIDARQVARNAFLAGNDLLYMDQLTSTGDENRFATYKETLTLFVQKYREDQAFAARVDESLIRILTLKFNLYKEFYLDNVIPDISKLENLSDGSEIVFEVAREAATLINPSQSQLNETIPSPPKFGERIVIFTDAQIESQCRECPSTEIFPVNGLQSSIINLYGPKASGQIGENQIISYSFKDLNDYVNNPFNRPEVGENLSRADWVLFALREVQPSEQNSFALHNLLAENPTVLRDKNVIVFSFDVPFIFDATEISAFTAYYGMYSKLPSFIDVAARIVFQEIQPPGSSPVSIPGVAYDLILAMTPQPDQIIPISVDEDAVQLISEEQLGEGSDLQQGLNPPVFKLGDNLPVKTGVILDHNQNPVPDGTVVRFTMNEREATTTIQQVESETENGIAKALFLLKNAGIHEIKVSSEPALNSQILVVDISEEEAIVSAINPTPIPTVDETLNGENDRVYDADEEEVLPNNKVAEWFFATIITWSLGILGFYSLRNYLSIENRIKVTIASIFGGLLNTAWLIFELPGTSYRYGLNGFIKLSFSIFVWELIGGILGWFYLRIIRPSLYEK